MQEDNDFDSTSILVYNVSHSDMLCTLLRPPKVSTCDACTSPLLHQTELEQSPEPSQSPQPEQQQPQQSEHHDEYVMARPSFSSWDLISQRVLARAQELLERDPSFQQQWQMLGLPVTDRQFLRVLNDAENAPVGVQLAEPLRNVSCWKDYHVRGRKDVPPETPATVRCIFFPLLSAVLPRWLANTRTDADSTRCVLVLVSGVSQPRNPNFEPSDNSTESTAKLLKLFVNHVFPRVEVVLLHDAARILRYDENVAFVNGVLLPEVRRRCVSLAERHSADWRQHFQLVLALADGTKARLAAIQAGLAHLRPDMVHMWQLKTLWFHWPSAQSMEQPWESDVEFHRSDAVLVRPSVSFEKCDPEVLKLRQQVVLWRDRFLASVVRDQDLRSFWLRKTKQPVLSVLMTRKEGEEAKFWCGINMEVSMPTGSLCSERNAIGTALSADPTLLRKHFRMIAVLSMTLNSDLIDEMRHQYCRTRETHSVEGELETLPVRTDVSDLGSAAELDWSPLELSPAPRIPSPSARVTTFAMPSSPRHTAAERAKLTLSPVKTGSRSVPPSVQRLSGRDSRPKGAPLNPLAPCGACSEWLKKIAEVNPEFRVITFSDTSCDQVFVRHLAL